MLSSRFGSEGLWNQITFYYEIVQTEMLGEQVYRIKCLPSGRRDILIEMFLHEKDCCFHAENYF